MIDAALMTMREPFSFFEDADGEKDEEPTLLQQVDETLQASVSTSWAQVFARDPNSGLTQAPPGLEPSTGCFMDQKESPWTPWIQNVGFDVPWKVDARGCYADLAEKERVDFVAEEQLPPSEETLGRSNPSRSKDAKGSARRPSQHRFFQRGKTEVFTEDLRCFTKTAKGRLSVVSENQVHAQGVVRYYVRFESGELSNADGVGLVFGSKVPVTSNLHKITSIFLNRTGRICKRSNEKVDRIPIRLPQIEVGDVIEIANNLDSRCMSFTIWNASGSASQSAGVDYGILGNVPTTKQGRNPSFLAVVVKNPGTTARLLS